MSFTVFKVHKMKIETMQIIAKVQSSVQCDGSEVNVDI